MTLSIGEISDRIFGTDVPFAVKAYDGSRGGNPDAVVTIDISNERALRYLVTAPGELGLARAYIQGDLLVEGSTRAIPTTSSRSSWTTSRRSVRRWASWPRS